MARSVPAPWGAGERGSSRCHSALIPGAENSAQAGRIMAALIAEVLGNAIAIVAPRSAIPTDARVAKIVAN
jgi:hypothetical protein